MPKIVHYREKCIGCDACVVNAPGYWKINEEDGKADLLRADKKKNVFVLDINELEAEENNDAAKSCPVDIIKIFR